MVANHGSISQTFSPLGFCKCRQRVQDRGLENSDVVIVGEAPGYTELEQGIAFVGPSGKLLDQTLDRVGIDPGSVLFTNAIPCMCPAEDKNVIEAYRIGLLEKIARHDRKLIISVGNVALKALTGMYDLKITRVRGTLFFTEVGNVLVTYHPAAILRSPNEYKTYLADFDYARELLGGIVRNPGVSSYIVLNTDDRVQRAIETLRKLDLVSADIETAGPGKGLNPYTDRIIRLGIGIRGNRTYVIPGERIEQFREVLEGDRPRWIWHNGKFDTQFLASMGINAKLDEDTEMMHYALNEMKGTHGLKRLATDYLGAEEYKDAVQKYGSMDRVPAKELNTYLSKDCSYTYQLAEKFRNQLENDPKLLRLYRALLMPASRFLNRVERNGLYVDKRALDELQGELESERDIALAEMREMIRDRTSGKLVRIAGLKNPLDYRVFNPGSPKQVSFVIYALFGLRPPQSEMRKFQFDTREQSLKLLGDHPFLVKLIQYRGAVKALGTYVEGFRRKIEADGRVHTTFLVHGTETGRLASRNPNTQNIPREKRIRRIVKAPAGYRIAEFDFSQAELRVCAVLSGDKALGQIYLDGKDLHSEVALGIFGAGYTEEQRQIAKHINFGILYGSGPSNLVDKFPIDMQTARESIERWKRLFPGAMAFVERCRKYPEQGRPLSTPFGRRRRWGLVNHDNLHKLQNEAGNFPIQSTASDLMLLAAMHIEKRIVGWGCRIVNLIHDSVTIEVPDDERVIRKVARYVIAVMRKLPMRVLGTKIPFDADGKIGVNWGDTTKLKV